MRCSWPEAQRYFLEKCHISLVIISRYSINRRKIIGGCPPPLLWTGVNILYFITKRSLRIDGNNRRTIAPNFPFPWFESVCAQATQNLTKRSGVVNEVSLLALLTWSMKLHKVWPQTPKRVFVILKNHY